MAEATVVAKCENGHEQKFTITGDFGAGLSDEQMELYWLNFIDLAEYSANNSPVGSKGCIECGGKVKMDVIVGKHPPIDNKRSRTYGRDS